MVRMPMIATVIALLVWTGPHTACVIAQPYDGDPASLTPDGGVQEVLLFGDGGLLYATPDQQSAIVCAAPDGQETA